MFVLFLFIRCSLFPEYPGYVVWLFVINFGKVSLIVTSNNFSVPFYFFYPSSIPISVNECYIICNCLIVLGYFIISFSLFCFLYILVFRVSIDDFQTQWFFPYLCLVYWWVHQKAFFISVSVFDTYQFILILPFNLHSYACNAHLWLHFVYIYMFKSL